MIFLFKTVQKETDTFHIMFAAGVYKIYFFCDYILIIN